MSSQYPSYRTREDLERLLSEGAVEGTRLEFKDSRSLTRDEPKITDLCINVSALANSAGGQIIFGINENKKTNGPVIVDEGVAEPTITREWIGQILNSRIQPRLPHYSIDAVDMNNGKFGFVISVPQSGSGPHQAPDKRYYKRFALEVRAMEDYEVRDVMRRSTVPDLHVTFELQNGERASLTFDRNSELSEPVLLFATVRNRSAQPAEHAMFRLGLSEGIHIPALSKPWRLLNSEENESYGKLNWLHQRHSSPPALPIFKEQEQPLDQTGLPLQFHSNTLAGARFWHLLIDIASPGFSSREAWAIHQHGSRIRLLHPGHPLMR